MAWDSGGPADDGGDRLWCGNTLVLWAASGKNGPTPLTVAVRAESAPIGADSTTRNPANHVSDEKIAAGWRGGRSSAADIREDEL